jgi:hypothetical protein
MTGSWFYPGRADITWQSDAQIFNVTTSHTDAQNFLITNWDTYSSVAVTVGLPVRVVVDPNSFSLRDPSLSVVSLDAFDKLPSVGDSVLAVQPDDDGLEGSARGTVHSIDEAHGLVYVSVDWSTFIVSENASHLQHFGTPGFTIIAYGPTASTLIPPPGTTENANALPFHEVAAA